MEQRHKGSKCCWENGIKKLPSTHGHHKLSTCFCLKKKKKAVTAKHNKGQQNEVRLNLEIFPSSPQSEKPLQIEQTRGQRRQ